MNNTNNTHKCDHGLWKKVAVPKFPLTVAEREKTERERIEREKAAEENVIVQSAERDPIGYTESLKIEDLFNDAVYPDFLERCNTKLTALKSVNEKAFIWMRFIYSEDTWTNYKVKSVDEIKRILCKLTSHFINVPDSTIPVLGVRAKLKITYEFTVITDNQTEPAAKKPRVEPPETE
jgi:hypothetical protein